MKLLYFIIFLSTGLAYAAQPQLSLPLPPPQPTLVSHPSLIDDDTFDNDQVFHAYNSSDRTIESDSSESEDEQKKIKTKTDSSDSSPMPPQRSSLPRLTRRRSRQRSLTDILEESEKNFKKEEAEINQKLLTAIQDKDYASTYIILKQSDHPLSPEGIHEAFIAAAKTGYSLGINLFLSIPQSIRLLAKKTVLSGLDQAIEHGHGRTICPIIWATCRSIINVEEMRQICTAAAIKGDTLLMQEILSISLHGHNLGKKLAQMPVSEVKKITPKERGHLLNEFHTALTPDSSQAPLKQKLNSKQEGVSDNAPEYEALVSCLGEQDEFLAYLFSSLLSIDRTPPTKYLNTLKTLLSNQKFLTYLRLSPFDNKRIRTGLSLALSRTMQNHEKEYESLVTTIIKLFLSDALFPYLEKDDLKKLCTTKTFLSRKIKDLIKKKLQQCADPSGESKFISIDIDGTIQSPGPSSSRPPATSNKKNGSNRRLPRCSNSCTML